MYFITSKADKGSMELAKNAAALLKENKIKNTFSKDIGSAVHKNELNEANCEIVVAIGDDSFILGTFRALGKLQIPVFAVASMQSFLAQANSLNFRHYMTLIKKNKYEILKRARLVARFGRTSSPIGLNDISLFSSKNPSPLKYSLILKY